MGAKVGVGHSEIMEVKSDGGVGTGRPGYQDGHLSNGGVAQGVRKTEWRKEKQTLSLISNMLRDIKK